jgi:hypothetical protein
MQGAPSAAAYCASTPCWRSTIAVGFGFATNQVWIWYRWRRGEEICIIFGLLLYSFDAKGTDPKWRSWAGSRRGAEWRPWVGTSFIVHPRG